MAKVKVEPTLDIRGNKEWDEEWDGTDPFTRVGPVRVVACKTNNMQKKYVSNRGVQVVYCNVFLENLTKFGRDHCVRWENDLLIEDEDVVFYYLEDRPNGFYELVGDLYIHEWISGYEEREYESEIQLRNLKIQPITYDQASKFDDRDVLKDNEIVLTKTDLTKDMYISPYGCEVNALMSRVDILRAHVTAICSVMRAGYYTQDTPQTDDMTEDQCEAMIHMCMLEIDSRSNENIKAQEMKNIAIAMDLAVEDVLKEHKELMG